MRTLKITGIITIVVVTFAIISAVLIQKTYAVNLSQDGWQRNDSGSYVYISDGSFFKGWLKDNGHWYYLDPSTGIMQTGWQEINGKRYYFAKSGAMRTGWQRINGSWYYLDTTSGSSLGVMQTGWYKENGYWYYFDTMGYMYQDTLAWINDKEYGFDSLGHMITGWYEHSEGEWYYFRSNGSAVSGLVTIEGVEYYFYEFFRGMFDAPFGELALNYYGIAEDFNTIITTDCNGVVIQKSTPAKNGWIQLDGHWYYAENGFFAHSEIKDIGNHTYGFDHLGRMMTGWTELFSYSGHIFDESGHLIKNRWVGNAYCGSDGQVWSGLGKVGNYWYYFPRWNDYQMCTGLVYVYFDHYSYFDENGHMLFGWIGINTDDGTNWYYADNDGVFVSGWQLIDETWYYFGNGQDYDLEGCVMQTGWQEIEGSTYYFRPSGAMAAAEWRNGYWFNSNGKWTYKYKASWKKNSKGWWFGDTSGWYAKDETIKIDGSLYTFDAEGYWIE